MANYHAQVLQDLGVEIVSVSGRPHSSRAREFAKSYGIGKVYDYWTDLVAAHDIDALWVTTSWDVTGELLLPLVRTGIPLFLEKPAALSSVVIKEALNFSELQGSQVVVGMNRRFYDFIPELRDFIATHPLRAVEVVLPEQTADRDDVLIENLWLVSSIHEIDLVWHLIGDMKIRYMHVKIDEHHNQRLNFNGVLVAEKSDVPVHILANWGTPSNKMIRFFFREHVIVLSPIEEMSIYHGMTKKNAGKRRTIASFDPVLKRMVRTSAKYKPGLYRQAEEFINMNGDMSAKEVHGTLRDAYRVTRLIEDMLQFS